MTKARYRAARAAKNIARVQNCPDITILNSLFGILVFLSCCIFCLFVLLYFCLFAFLSFCISSLSVFWSFARFGIFVFLVSFHKERNRQKNQKKKESNKTRRQLKEFRQKKTSKEEEKNRLNKQTVTQVPIDNLLPDT